MKNILFTIVLLFTITSGGMQTNAFEVLVGEEVYVTEEVNDDFYVAGGSITITTPINGDLLIVGGDINVNSNIEQDLIITGGNIVVSGNIGDDVRIAGGAVTINSNIEGDLIIGAGDVRIYKGVVIKGDLLVGAGRIIMDGEVMGKAKIGAGQLVLNGTIHGDAEINIEEFSNPSNIGIIKGNLNYTSDSKILDLESASRAKVIFKKSFIKDNIEKGLITFISSIVIIKIIGLFLFSTLFYLYFQKYFSKVSDNLKKQTGKSFLYGFLTIIGLPVIIILLFISVIGIPFALLFLFGYIFMFVFLSLINIIVFTSFVVDKYMINQLYKKLLIILGLTLVFGLINGIGLLVGFFTLGAIAIKKIDIIKSLRK
ncbi:MAG: hypothetical protein QM490_04315 [Candidatus Gracilibacteria bacterium]